MCTNEVWLGLHLHVFVYTGPSHILQTRILSLSSHSYSVPTPSPGHGQRQRLGRHTNVQPDPFHAAAGVAVRCNPPHTIEPHMHQPHIPHHLTADVDQALGLLRALPRSRCPLSALSASRGEVQRRQASAESEWNRSERPFHIISSVHAPHTSIHHRLPPCGISPAVCEPPRILTA